MTHLHRQAEEQAHRRHEAQQQPERDVRGKPRDVGAPEPRPAVRPLGTQTRDDARVPGDGAVETVPDEPVFHPAADQRTGEQQHAGERREQGRGPQQRDRLENVFGGMAIDERGAKRGLPAPLDGQHQRRDHREVAEDAGGLRADQVGDLVDEAFDRRIVGDIGELFGQRRRGHGRLLGGHRAVHQVHDQKTHGVIHAGPKAAPERRHGQGDHEELHEGGAGDHRAATGRGLEHLAVRGAVTGDVVMTHFGAALGHLAREQRVVVGKQRCDAAPFGGGAHQFGQQPGHVAGSLAADHAVQQLLDAVGAQAQLIDVEHHADRNAMLFEVVVHAVGATPAAVEQGAQVLRFLQQRGLVAGQRPLADPVGSNGQLAKRPMRQQIAAHALSQGPRERGRTHRTGQKHDRVEQRCLPCVIVDCARRHQAVQAVQRGFVQRIQPQRVIGGGKEQPEQLRQVGGGRGDR